MAITVQKAKTMKFPPNKFNKIQKPKEKKYWLYAIFRISNHNQAAVSIDDKLETC